jgi:hypothetical protein
MKFFFNHFNLIRKLTDIQIELEFETITLDV